MSSSSKCNHYASVPYAYKYPIEVDDLDTIGDIGVAPVFRYEDQLWAPSSVNPYPMTFMQAPSEQNQVRVNFQNQDLLQGLSTIRGPFMFDNPRARYKKYEKSPKMREGFDPMMSIPARQFAASVWTNTGIAYPTNHSIPGPFLRSYINGATPFMY